MIPLLSYRILLLTAILFFFLCVLYCVLTPENQSCPDPVSGTRKPLMIITEIDPPYAYLDRTGEIRGKSIALVKIIAERTNTQYTLEFLPWSAAYGRVLSNPGTALVPTTWTEERAPLFRWVGPIDTIHYAFFARADDPVHIQNMPEDLQAVSSIAVVRNTAKHQQLLMENITNIMTYATEYDCMDALLTGRADLWCGTDDMFLDDSHVKGGDHAKIRRVCLWRTKKVYIAFHIDTPDEVILAWQNAYDSLEPEVTAKLLNQYLPYYCSWIDCLPDFEKKAGDHVHT